LAASCLFAQTPARVETFPLRDTAGLIAPKVKTEGVKYMGRESVRITVEGEDRDGLALLPGTDFQDGAIKGDIALKITTPPGVGYPGFVGIAFRVRPDASHYELFYVRPGTRRPRIIAEPCSGCLTELGIDEFERACGATCPTNPQTGTLPQNG
jgi:hypothetical protein